MLFVSRRIAPNLFGVVDTTDNSEECVDVRELQKIAALGVYIKGVDTKIVIDECSVQHTMITHVKVAQNPETVTAAQTKLLVMNHVDIKVYKDMITSITWDPYRITKPVRIRLSDYCSLCSDQILVDNIASKKHKVTLVFDDKIRVSCHSIIRESYNLRVCDLGVALDIREVTDDDILFAIYQVIRYDFSSSTYSQKPFEYLIDRPDRLECFRKSLNGGELS